MRTHVPPVIGAAYMRSFAIAQETKVLLKAQSDVYKDLGLGEHYTELMTNPTVGLITIMLPSAYQIGGVGGQLREFQPGMTGPTRLHVSKTILYGSASSIDPEFFMRTRVKWHPRLVTVLSFAIFKGPMALHPCDIEIVPEAQLL
jgi:hypothetical protein